MYLFLRDIMKNNILQNRPLHCTHKINWFDIQLGIFKTILTILDAANIVLKAGSKRVLIDSSTLSWHSAVYDTPLSQHTAVYDTMLSWLSAVYYTLLSQHLAVYDTMLSRHSAVYYTTLSQSSAVYYTMLSHLSAMYDTITTFRSVVCIIQHWVNIRHYTTLSSVWYNVEWRLGDISDTSESNY